MSLLLRVLAKEEIGIEVSFTPAFRGHGRHRPELSSAAWHAISAALAERRAEAAFSPAEPPDVVPMSWWDSTAYGDFVLAEFRRQATGPRDRAGTVAPG